MVQHSLEPTPPPAPSPSTSALITTAAEHERAAMLAEFNGTYDLAREHREAAARLRRLASDIDTA